MGKKVSIIIPVYNGANYVKEAIDSALAQTYKNIEIIVVNDGSTDKGATRKAVLSYGDKVKYYEKENGGVSTALNLGIENMNGEYFSWLSHDDLYYPTKVERQMEEMKKYDDNTILYSDCDVIDLNGKVFATSIYDHELLMKKPDYALLRGCISGISLLIPKKAFEKHGGFDTKLRCVQDYLKWFEFLEDYTFIHIPEVLVASRVHPKQVTLTSPKMLTEGNWLWTYMAENYPLKKKIECEGSEYLFYKELENSLKISPYKEAEKNIHELAEKSLIETKKKSNNKKTAIVILDNGNKKDLEKTKESIKKQTAKNIEIIIEKSIEQGLKKIKADYFSFLHAGVTVKENWIETEKLISITSNKGVIVSDYKRPISDSSIDNYATFLVPIDGVFFKRTKDIEYKNIYQFILDNALINGSITTEDKYLNNVVEDYNIPDAYDYLSRVLKTNKATNYQLATLNYDISVIYNKYSKDGKKVTMYEDSDEFRELKYSRSFRLYQKYYNYKKKKRKTI